MAIASCHVCHDCVNVVGDSILQPQDESLGTLNRGRQDEIGTISSNRGRSAHPLEAVVTQHIAIRNGGLRESALEKVEIDERSLFDKNVIATASRSLQDDACAGRNLLHRCQQDLASGGVDACGDVGLQAIPELKSSGSSWQNA